MFPCDLFNPQDLSAAHSKAVTGVAWRGETGSLVSGALDRTIKVFASAAH
jgi:WD40 repeat protein